MQSANVGSDVWGTLGGGTPVARLVRTTPDTRDCTDVQISSIPHGKVASIISATYDVRISGANVRDEPLFKLTFSLT